MNGRLAKAIRRAVGFHPAVGRQYRAAKQTGWFVGMVTAEGRRRDYQKLKASGLARKWAAA